MTRRRVFGLFLVVLLAVMQFGVVGATQSPAASDIPADSQLAGIQQSVWRDYGPAGSTAGTGSPDIIDATPMASVAGQTVVHHIGVHVRQFDTAEHAAMAFTPIGEGAAASLTDGPWDGTLEITIRELPGIGSQAVLSRLDYSSPATNSWIEYVTVQRDAYVFLVSARGSVSPDAPGSAEVDTSLPTVDIATEMATNGAPSPDEPVFSEDGTSTGGLWGFMPAHDDPLLADLVPQMDTVLYPLPAP